MKAVVVGFGSIGVRHARLLGGLGLNVAVVSRRKVEAAKVYPTIAAAVADFAPDYAVVASRTHEHWDDVTALAKAGFTGTVLVEKPLFDRLHKIPAHRFKHVFIAYQLRFHPVIRRLKALLDEATPHAVHAYVGHDLSAWCPRDYKKNFRARKTEGGGVLRDLSHEIDYLNWMLGGWTRLTALGSHVSDLKIDSDDAFSLLFETRRCPVVTLNMNYLDTTLRRRVLALTDNGSILADLVAGTVEFRGNTKSFEIGPDDTYIAEHKAALSGDAGTLCTLTEGLAVVGMIDAAETAAARREWAAA